ncbi:MAG: metallophosphoesterase family protein [Bacteroidota bacterium]
MPRQLALSDLHGCNQTFLAMLDRLAFSKADTLYLLGDYVDRGPDSKGVIDTIWRLQTEGYTVECLMGNHEELTIKDYEHEASNGWTGLGDPTLLRSFKAMILSEIPVKYIDWMRNLAKYKEIPGYVLVHAGLNFDVKDPLSNEKDLLWIRNWYEKINYAWLGDRIIVHGHTPMSVEMAKAMFKEIDETQVQDIDCGAALRQNDAFGQLCAFDLSNRALIFQPNVENL